MAPGPSRLLLCAVAATAILDVTMQSARAQYGAPATAASTAPVLVAQPTVKRVHGAFHLVDATAASGLVARPVNRPVPPLVQAMGCGLAFSGYWRDRNGSVHLNDLYVCGPGGGRYFTSDLKGHFTETTARMGISPAPGEIACLFADFDNDGLPELVVTGVAGVRFYKNKGDGTFEDWTRKVHMDGTGPAFGVVAMDANADKYLDLFVAGFVDPSTPPSSAQGQSPVGWPAGTPAFDALKSRRCFYFQNNGGVGVEEKPRPGHMVPAPRPWTGTFTECASRVGLALDGQRVLGGVMLDYDTDFKPDLLAVGPTGVHLMHNKGDGTFEDTTNAMGLAGITGILAAAVQDVDGDTQADIVLSGLHGLRLFRAGDDRFIEVTRESGLAQLDAALGPSGITFGVGIVDLDMDTFPDLVAFTGSFDSTGGRWLIAHNRGDGTFVDATREMAAGLALPATARGLSIGDANNDGNPDLAVSTRDGAVALAVDMGDAGHWFKLRPQGLLCNKDAVGARLRVVLGQAMVTQLVQAGSGYLSSNSRELCVGTGEHAKGTTDIQWPSMRTEPATSGNTDVAIEKKEGEPSSSCPILFAHDGTGYRYVTDILGGGVLGLYVGGGHYKLPDPDETIRIPPGLLRADSGRLRLGVLEPLEEVDYLDAFRLAAVDHPRDVEVYPDERLGPPPYPHFDIVGLTDLRPPRAAHDDRGHDVLPLVATADRRAPDGFGLLPWMGFARPHWLELDLGPLPSPGPVYMVLSGWVEYATSSSIAQAEAGGVLSEIPTLLVADGHGGFVPAQRALGCPAGARKDILYRIDGLFPSHDHRVRIRTNWSVYWDQIRIGRAVDPSLLGVTWLPLGGATLSHGGFPVADSPDGRAPTEYLWDLREDRFDVGLPAGDCTRYGDVGPLLTAPDDRVVVMAPGDQLELWFSSRPEPELGRGQRRTYLVLADGWFKDLDPATLAHETVLPLPYHAMESYPPPSTPRTAAARAAVARGQAAAARWNTRTLVPRTPMQQAWRSPPLPSHREHLQ